VWVDHTRAPSVVQAIDEAAARLSGPRRLEVDAEVARLQALLGDRDRAWQRLVSTYRAAGSRLREGQPASLIACAGTLLRWDHKAAGLALLRHALQPGDDLPEEPELPSAPDSVATETAALAAVLQQQPCRVETAALAAAHLMRAGEGELALLALAAGAEATHRIVDRGANLRARVTLARYVSDGVDLPLRARVEEAARDEAALILDRLRVDDPP
jgi:hypothetical protein